MIEMLQPYPDIPIVLQLSLWANISRAATDGLSSLSTDNVSTGHEKRTRRLSGFYPQKVSFSFLAFILYRMVICSVCTHLPLVRFHASRRIESALLECIP
jgi:hypothetical protein